ncbi:hypothetical protein Pelo_14826 [Pelomyxa schiedti]|nr:hypothetical protein Pelo_14826 [Pelomyxa schiedti]
MKSVATELWFLTGSAREEITIDLLGNHVRVILVDIAGSERFLCIAKSCMKQANGALICFGIANPGSFDRVLEWKKLIDVETTKPNKPAIPCWLAAQKCDEQFHCKSNCELETFSKEHNFSGWSLCSAKVNLGTEATLKGLLAVIYQLNLPI